MPTEDYATPDEGVPLIRVTNIRPDTSIDMTNVKYIRTDSKGLDRKLVRKDDIIMVQCGNTTGKVAIVPKELEGYAYASFCFRIRLKAGINPHYLLAILDSSIGQQQIWRTVTYTTVRPNTTKPFTKALKIPLPLRSVQDRIAAVVQETRVKRWSLLAEAETVVTNAKVRVEQLILEEDMPGSEEVPHG